MCVTGLTLKHVGECFQRANDTLSKYFKEILFAFSSAPIHTDYVHLPSANDSIPPEIQNNPKLFPFFSGAIGTIDGTHIACAPKSSERHLSRNNKEPAIVGEQY
ncbi:hypothetical protein SERLA73DRAFT_143249 [Serpula lacrymans var. lacrymans S7.3]|uniref:DDE Tnp4 domain-containing protein n=1 Tax=Serpula lacrymans var. lacrymans (strain S7.3) TaxID=936435 RepID=F8Q9A9_SERL3|nr:hypothetical protein SERLA73DRAFT_143249 [Serpula lacrymans var. lacrymans S7.3]